MKAHLLLVFLAPCVLASPLLRPRTTGLLPRLSQSSGPGDLTWYGPAPDAAVSFGACGHNAPKAGFMDTYIALNYQLYGSWANPNEADVCGACIEVTGPHGSIIGQVADMCPGCPGIDDLDVSPTIFKAVNGGSLDAGRIKITWRQVACDGGAVGATGGGGAGQVTGGSSSSAPESSSDAERSHDVEVPDAEETGGDQSGDGDDSSGDESSGDDSSEDESSGDDDSEGDDHTDDEDPADGDEESEEEDGHHWHNDHHEKK